MNKKIIATILGGVGILGATTHASAGTIDGITFGDGAFSFVASTIMERAVGGGIIDSVGDVLEGVGRVTEIYSGADLVWQNGDNGKELTFTFGDYTASSVSGSLIEFTGGFTRFYSDATTTSSFGTGIGFANGNLWMDTIATSFVNSATGNVVTLASTGTLLGNSISGTGIGLLSVTGAGLADAFFDTNTHVAFGTGNIADWELNSSFNNAASPFSFGTHGTANISGTSVPEPSSIALLGLGLMGFAATRRKQA